MDGAVIFLHPRLFCHLEEEKVGQLRNVLVVCDAVVSEHIAERPELLDDVVGIHTDVRGQRVGSRVNTAVLWKGGERMSSRRLPLN